MLRYFNLHLGISYDPIGSAMHCISAFKMAHIALIQAFDGNANRHTHVNNCTNPYEAQAFYTPS